MKETKTDGGGLICISSQELVAIKGGVAVAFLDNFWGYIKKAISFVNEYRDEIINGLKRGWKNL